MIAAADLGNGAGQGGRCRRASEVSVDPQAEPDRAELNPYASPLAERGIVADPPQPSIAGRLSRRKLRAIFTANAVITCCAVVTFGGAHLMGREAFARLLGPCYGPLAILAILSVPAFFAGLGHVLFLCIRGLTGEPRLLFWAGCNLPLVITNGLFLYWLD